MKREVIVPPGFPFGRVLGCAAIIWMLGSTFIAPRTLKVFRESKVDIAKLEAAKFANEAYPRWHREHHGCPESLDELLEYTDPPNTLDPWGEHYRLVCAARGIVVWSLGEDRTPNTRDDIRSDQ